MQGKMDRHNITNYRKPGVWGRDEKIPHAFYFRYVKDLKLHDIQVEWENAGGEWENALRFENIENLEIDSFSGRQGKRKTDSPAIFLSDVKKAFIHGCNTPAGTGTFLSLEGRSTKQITVIGNNFSEAQKAFKSNKDLKGNVLFQAANHLPPSEKREELNKRKKRLP